MADAKPFASLSSGLLARKGGAKPAMRPQGFGSFGGSLEDLGWNDMGTPEHYDHVPTPIDALTPAPKARPAVVEVDEPVEAPEPPPILEQQRALRRSFAEPEPRAESAEVVALPRPRTQPGKAKAAFTLRLDPDRHLKLRLACALTNRSAQMLVTEALDQFLAAHPEVEALAEHVPAEGSKRSSR
jgi:hypothetical protein